jgi:uncharacterized membrane protein
MEETARIVQAIRAIEKQTSGEIRVFIESHCRFVDPIERAREVFYHLKMNKTELKNGVIVYVATRDRQVALFGDSGIYERLGAAYWRTAVQNMVLLFKEHHYAEGLEKCVEAIGATLSAYFPYNHHDKNELPDDIVFGK